MAEIKRSGTDVSLIATSSMVGVCLEAAERLEALGVSAEVVDHAPCSPLDKETLIESVRKTGYAVVVDEGVLRYGVTGELVALVSEEAFDYLDAPVKRVGAAEIPVPFSPPLEMPTIPDVERVVEVVQSIRN